MTLYESKRYPKMQETKAKLKIRIVKVQADMECCTGSNWTWK